MYVTCLDLEGVLVPEIWIAFAEETGIEEYQNSLKTIFQKAKQAGIETIFLTPNIFFTLHTTSDDVIPVGLITFINPLLIMFPSKHFNCTINKFLSYLII